MIDLYFWPTGNGKKVVILLEECGLPYTIKPINIGRGDQLTPDFLKISPNGRMPAIVDDEPMGGGAPISIFESGAIMTYLAEKTGRFDDAETFFRRAVAIASASLPVDHPMIAASRQNLEDFCRARGLPIDTPGVATPAVVNAAASAPAELPLERGS